ncbi:NUDIX hydrolase domain-like protein [Sphaerosporella brunnea]|uniref:NUDIX hydrolase domain-like protein n=1 Tax=Sphaerosporella brunnea TaxID=1250544 RepID=A0A5J5F1H8_9PEZI|nr:NUDIX hydrolase domain-like protein [Sphaerosporella brunnea]
MSTTSARLYTYTHTASPSLDPFVAASTSLLAQPPYKHLNNLCVGAFIFRGSPTSRQILLLRRAATEPSFPSLWEVPGGGCEATDLSVLDTVAREVQEETGLTVARIGEFLGFVEFEGRTGSRWGKANFVVEVVPGTESEVRVDPNEHGESGWFSEADCRSVEFTTELHRACVMQAFARVGGRVGGGGVVDGV